MKRISNIEIFQLAFRPFFLFGAIFSVLALVFWLTILYGLNPIQAYGNGVWWHTHEMLFGFVTAIVVGFLLTAVQNWTGTRGLNNNRLMLLVLLWTLARLLLIINPPIPALIIACIDIAFLPLSAVFLAQPLIRSKQAKNMIFIPVLALLTVSNICMHWGLLNQNLPFSLKASHLTVILIVFLVCVIGGRVIPMFTASGTQTTAVTPLKWLEKIALISIGVVAMTILFEQSLANEIKATIFFSTALIHFSRMIRWRFWITYNAPLVWTLHLSYLCIPAAMVGLGFYYLNSSFTFSASIHLLTTGTIGLIILSMISRVSLGHTGRKIISDRTILISFYCLLFSVFFRVLSPLFMIEYLTGLFLSVVAWTLAYGLFVFRYYSILTTPRVDDK